MDVVSEQTGVHEWGEYAERRVLAPPEFIKEISEKLKEKDILSVGEHHDLEQDASYGWIQQFAGEIFEAYDWYRLGKITGKEPMPFERLLRRESKLVEKLMERQPSFEELKKMHVGRFFALGVLPLAKAAGYTDLVLEGFDEISPGASYQLSKDKTGDLLRLTYAMILGFNIHGAWPRGQFVKPEEVGDSIFEKIKAAKTSNPEAKILVYNGAMHNVTEPFKLGSKVSLGIFGETDPNEWSYAPRARELWGEWYGAMDLMNGGRPLPNSHFKYMQEKAEPGQITRFTHGIDQQTYILN